MGLWGKGENVARKSKKKKKTRLFFFDGRWTLLRTKKKKGLRTRTYDVMSVGSRWRCRTLGSGISEYKSCCCHHCVCGEVNLTSCSLRFVLSIKK